jgi:hypothetical protein
MPFFTEPEGVSKVNGVSDPETTEVWCVGYWSIPFIYR